MAEPKKENLKVLRVQDASHLAAKVNAAKNKLKLQVYVEKLIAADEQGIIVWSKFKISPK